MAGLCADVTDATESVAADVALQQVRPYEQVSAAPGGRATETAVSAATIRR
jgi:hypothetical protein